LFLKLPNIYLVGGVFLFCGDFFFHYNTVFQREVAESALKSTYMQL